MLVQIVKNKSFYCSKNFSSLHIWTAIIYNRDYKQWIKHIIIIRLQSDGHLCERHTKTEKKTEAPLSLNSACTRKNVKISRSKRKRLTNFKPFLTNQLKDGCNRVLELLPSYKTDNHNLQKCSQIC